MLLKWETRRARMGARARTYACNFSARGDGNVPGGRAPPRLSSPSPGVLRLGSGSLLRSILALTRVREVSKGERVARTHSGTAPGPGTGVRARACAGRQGAMGAGGAGGSRAQGVSPVFLRGSPR